MGKIIFMSSVYFMAFVGVILIIKISLDNGHSWVLYVVASIILFAAIVNGVYETSKPKIKESEK